MWIENKGYKSQFGTKRPLICLYGSKKKQDSRIKLVKNLNAQIIWIVLLSNFEQILLKYTITESFNHIMFW